MAATFGAPGLGRDPRDRAAPLRVSRRARSLPVALALCRRGRRARGARTAPAPSFPMEITATPLGVALAAYTVIGVVVGVARRRRHPRRLRHRGRLRAPADPLDVVAGDRRRRGRHHRLPRRRARWASDTTTSSTSLDGTLAGQVLLLLVVCKLVSWSIALGSGTSGGTLAPLFTIGGGARRAARHAGRGAAPVARHRSARGGARRHGRDVRRRVARAARLRRLRLRGDAAADGPAAAARRMHRRLPRLAPHHAAHDHDRAARAPRARP